MANKNNPENVIPWSTFRAAMKRRKRTRKPSGPENMHSTAQSSEHPDQRSLPLQSFPGSVLKCPFPGQPSATDPCTSAVQSGHSSALSRSWGDKSIPIHGYTQPRNGAPFDIALGEMSKNQNPRSARTITAAHRLARQRLSENISDLIDIHFPASKYATQSDRQKAFARAAGLSWSTVQRVLSGKVSATTDTLVDLANVFGVSISDLTTPNFAQTYERRSELLRRSG